MLINEQSSMRNYCVRMAGAVALSLAVLAGPLHGQTLTGTWTSIAKR